MADDLKVLTVEQNRREIDPGFFRESPIATVLAGVDFEMQFNADGTFAGGPTFISGSDKIIQDVAKGLLTILGSNALTPNYGTRMSSLLHSRGLENVSSQLVAEINYLLGYLGDFNADQPLSEQAEELIELKAKEGTGTIDLAMIIRTGTGQHIGVTLS
jgi:hypothetical protein